MPRNAAIARTPDATPDTRRITPRTVAVSLSHAETIDAWDALVARCGSMQAAFEALVLLPDALEAAGIDPGAYLRCRTPR